MTEIKRASRSQIRAAEILNDMGRGNAATRAIANAKRTNPAQERLRDDTVIRRGSDNRI